MSRPRNDQSRWNVLALIDLFFEKNGCSPTVREICGLSGIKAESHVWKLLQELIQKKYITCLNNKARTYQITPAGKEFLKTLRDQGENIPSRLPSPQPASVQKRLSPRRLPRMATYVNQAASISVLNLAKIIEIPVLGRTFASALTMVDASGFGASETGDTLSVSLDMLPREGKSSDLFALEVRGNSMIEAHIRSGDFIIVTRAETANNGDMVVVFLDDENETTLKYFFREQTCVRLEPANSKMKPIIIDSSRSLRIIGKVVRVVRQ